MAGKAGVCVGDTASPCVTVRGGHSSPEHKPVLGYQTCMGHTQSLWAGSAHTAPLPFKTAMQEDLWVFVTKVWWGWEGCGVTFKFEFLCFSWLMVFLIFCLQWTCAGKRTFLQKEIFGKHILCFLHITEECFNTAFLFACFPYGSLSPSVCFYDELQSKSAIETINE